MIIRHVLLVILSLVFVTACSDHDEKREEFSIFDPDSSDPQLPFPSDLYMGEDGTLDLSTSPSVADDDYSDRTVALNTLDGFSTTAPISMDFTASIDPDSILAGQNIRVFEVQVDEGRRPTSVVGELTAGSDYQVVVSSVDDSRLLVKPLLPLQAKSAYLIAVTRGLVSTQGKFFYASGTFNQLLFSSNVDADIEYAQAYVQAQQQVLAAANISAESLVLAFSFSTQSIGDVLEQINANASARNVTLSQAMVDAPGGGQTPLTTAPFAGLSAFFGLTPAGQVDIYTGTIDVPYYLNTPVSTTDDAVLDSFLQDAEGLPLTRMSTTPVVTRSDLAIPVLVTLPNTSIDPSLVKPAAGWPIAIYHHGITGNRTNALLIADAIATRGVAVIAIDQPVHGVLATDAGFLPLNLFAAAGFSFYDAANERHFNLDLDGDEEVDPSGSHYGSPRNLLTSRGHARQSVSDLIYLIKSIPDIQVPGVNGPAFDATQVQFVGLSLGAFAGILFSAVSDDFNAASLAAPGGGGSKSSEGSPSSHDAFVDNLSAQGFEQGTLAYEDVIRLSTTIGGAADPINYAAAASAMHPIHLTEIVGDGTEQNPPDQTVPNSVLNEGLYAGLVVETAPLAGTEALIRVMGLQSISETTLDTNGLRGVVRFTQGDHQSQVSPSDAISEFAVPAVTAEIQTETASFVATGGQTIEIGDVDFVQ